MKVYSRYLTPNLLIYFKKVLNYKYKDLESITNVNRSVLCRIVNFRAVPNKRVADRIAKSLLKEWKEKAQKEKIIDAIRMDDTTFRFPWPLILSDFYNSIDLNFDYLVANNFLNLNVMFSSLISSTFNKPLIIASQYPLKKDFSYFRASSLDYLYFYLSKDDIKRAKKTCYVSSYISREPIELHINKATDWEVESIYSLYADKEGLSKLEKEFKKTKIKVFLS